MDARSFAAIVDHTLLKPDATEEQIVQVCIEALEMETLSVCVNGLWVSRVSQELAGSDIKTCSVVGFPLGAMDQSSVGGEAARAVDQGAGEIDMVVPIGLLKGGNGGRVADYIREVRERVPDVTLKVILEAAILTDDEIIRGCRSTVEAGADFVKTSTGFNPAGGASLRAVELMRGAVGGSFGVKASGGIRALHDVEELLAAGANRFGMSATASVIEEIKAR